MEAFINKKTKAWITAHVHMYKFFGGVTPMLVPDNCTTAVNHQKSDWYNQLGGASNPLADPILNRMVHETYMISIQSIDAIKDI